MTGRGIGDCAQTTSSPHDSNLGSKLDPRVDCDRDGRSGLGASTQGDAVSHDPVSTPGTSTSGGIGSGATRVGSGGVGAFDMDPTTTGQLPRGHDANNDQPKIYE